MSNFFTLSVFWLLISCTAIATIPVDAPVIAATKTVVHTNAYRERIVIDHDPACNNRMTR